MTDFIMGMNNLPYETWARHHESGVPFTWLWPAAKVLRIGGDLHPAERRAMRGYLGMFCVVPDPGHDEWTLCPGCGHILTAPGMLGIVLGSFEWGIVHGEGHCRECDWPVVAYHKLTDDLRFDFPLPYHPWFVIDALTI